MLTSIGRLRLVALIVFIFLHALAGCSGKTNDTTKAGEGVKRVQPGTEPGASSPESSKPSEPLYVSDEGGFRVHFLVMPTVKKVAVPAGESTMYTANVDEARYAVSWIPVRLGAQDEVKAYLEEVAGAFAAQPFVLRTRVSAEITLDGRPGRELGVQTQVGEMHLRWYVSSGRLYQVMVGPVEAIDSEAVRRFFASFAFNP